MRSFRIELSNRSDPAQQLAHARERAGEAGIEFEGDSMQGTFSGIASGTYRLEEEALIIDVSSKPTFVPWALLERELRAVFREPTD